MLELFNYRLILSVSFLLAAFTWTVPLAAIYPPSAILIDTTPFLVTERLPISVPEITFTSDFDLLNVEKASRLAIFSIGRGSGSGSEISLSFGVQRPFPFLLQFVQSVILGGEIVQTGHLLEKTLPTYSISWGLNYHLKRRSLSTIRFLRQSIFTTRTPYMLSSWILTLAISVTLLILEIRTTPAILITLVKPFSLWKPG
jgi:hypothetical protein